MSTLRPALKVELRVPLSTIMSSNPFCCRNWRWWSCGTAGANFCVNRLPSAPQNVDAPATGSPGARMGVSWNITVTIQWKEILPLFCQAFEFATT